MQAGGNVSLQSKGSRNSRQIIPGTVSVPVMMYLMVYQVQSVYKLGLSLNRRKNRAGTLGQIQKKIINLKAEKLTIRPDRS